MIYEPTGWSAGCDGPVCGNTWYPDAWEPSSEDDELLHDLRQDGWIVLGDGFYFVCYVFCSLDCLLSYREGRFRRHAMKRQWTPAEAPA